MRCSNEGSWFSAKPRRLAPAQDGTGSSDTEAGTSTSTASSSSTSTAKTARMMRQLLLLGADEVVHQ
jgi:hypothetical protein